MSEYWKLNINDYTLTELEDLFELKNPHTLEDIVSMDANLNDRINYDSSLGPAKKIEIIDFLNKAREILIGEQKKEMVKIGRSQVHTGDDHMTIRRPTNDQFLMNTNVNYEYGRGKTLASNENPVFTTVLSINSKFRSNYYTTLSTDYLISLPKNIKQVVSMSLTAFEMPNTYFQISKSLGNNYFWVGWQKGDTFILNWYFISIPDGTYNRKDMESIININIQKATGLPADDCPQCSIDAASLRTVFALPITITKPAAFFHLAFNRTRGDHTITDASQNELTPADLDSKRSNIARKFGWLLGFRMAEYKASTAYVSEGVYDSWGTKYVYLIIDDFNKNFANLIEPIYYASLGKDNILARISLLPVLSALTNGTSLAGQYNPGDTTRQYFGPVNIEKLRITIVDEFGRVLNLNNMDYSLALTFKCLYS